MLESRQPTILQRVFDALSELGQATSAEVAEKIGVPVSAVKQAMVTLKNRGKVEWAKRAPQYRLSQSAQRPTDGRGRKRA